MRRVRRVLLGVLDAVFLRDSADEVLAGGLVAGEPDRDVAQILVLVNDFGVAGNVLGDLPLDVAFTSRNADQYFVLFRAGISVGSRRRDAAERRRSTGSTGCFQECTSIELQSVVVCHAAG